MIWTIFVLFANAANEVTHDTIEYSQIANGRPDTIEEGFIINYKSKNGYIVKKNDVLTIGIPLGNTSQISGIAGGGSASGWGAGAVRATSVGEAYFSNIYNGTYASTIAKMLLSSFSGTYDPTIYMAPSKLSGAEIIVSAMRLYGTKKKPLIWVECTMSDTRQKTNASGILTIGDYELGIQSGEIIDERNITREIAIQKLKEAKELLDLGIYTPSQYEAEKKKYTPYIINQ